MHNFIHTVQCTTVLCTYTRHCDFLIAVAVLLKNSVPLHILLRVKNLLNGFG